MPTRFPRLGNRTVIMYVANIWGGLGEGQMGTLCTISVTFSQVWNSFQAQTFKV